jgi:hypothetical protein
MFASNTSQVSSDAVFVEDIFSTTLYTGNGSTQTINNGIDLAGKGGLVWIKTRSDTGGVYTGDHVAHDTARGVNKTLRINSTAAQSTRNGVTAFNADGFTTGGLDWENRSGMTYASWTFRKQPKFFDVVTYTGDGTSGQTISHSLGSTPGCIIVKRTDAAENWVVYHKYMFDSAGTYGSQGYINLNLTGSSNYVGTDLWSPTATTFKAFGTSVNINTSGATYVAYLFAHNAGGFGLTGTDNVISCGMATMPAGGGPVTVNLGWEPQWVLMKDINHTGGCQWFIQDNMRGWPAESTSAPDYKYLQAHLSSAEGTSNTNQGITSTGFSINSGFNYADGNTNIIYIAIRRGPMKVPTSGTSVFAPVLGASATPNFVTNFPVDFSIVGYRSSSNNDYAMSRLQGGSVASGGPFMQTNSTAAEATGSAVAFDIQNGFGTSGFGGSTQVGWNWKRAPSFFDEVCYTGTGVARTVTHNLGVAPEMYIIKRRDGTGTNWAIYSAYLSPANDKNLYFTTAGESTNTNIWSTPTSTTFGIGTGLQSAAALNANGSNYVAYLFATCAGVSKCTAFTGTGTLQTINCGFTAGSRFVLIKRTDAAGDWYVWDSSRGLSSSTDPYLLLNSTAAEVTSTNWVDTTATGFQVTAASGNNVNINGASYIALAIS